MQSHKRTTGKAMVLGDEREAGKGGGFIACGTQPLLPGPHSSPSTMPPTYPQSNPVEDASSSHPPEHAPHPPHQ